MGPGRDVVAIVFVVLNSLQVSVKSTNFSVLVLLKIVLCNLSCVCVHIRTCICNIDYVPVSAYLFCSYCPNPTSPGIVHLPPPCCEA